MNPDATILELAPWAPILGPLFAQALNPATPAPMHHILAEQAASTLEQALPQAAPAPDEEAPWRALRTEDALFLATEDGFAFAQFEGPILVSLRVETEDGRRWSAIFTGRGLAAFDLLAGSATSPDPDLKVALFDDERLLWSQSYYPDGRSVDDRDLQGALEEARASADLEGGSDLTEDGGAGTALGAGLGAGLGGMVLGAGALLARRALARKLAPAPPQVPIPPSPPASPEAPGSAAPTWRIVGTSGPMKGRAFTVHGTLIAGREGVDIPVEDLSVSRRHAELRARPQGLELRDLGSSNGTWIGDNRLFGAVLLQDGDAFLLGTCAFRAERTTPATPPALLSTTALPRPTPSAAPVALPSPAPPPAALPPSAPGPRCPACQALLDPAWKFCGTCGAPRPAPESRRFCGQCGTRMPEGSRFCPACGRPA